MAKLLYFAVLADRLGRTAEDVTLPPTVTGVRTLLASGTGRYIPAPLLTTLR